MRWCDTCRTMRTVIDRHSESFYDGGSGNAHEYGYVVFDLDCGHETNSGAQVIGPAPGAEPSAPTRGQSYTADQDPT